MTLEILYDLGVHLFDFGKIAFCHCWEVFGLDADSELSDQTFKPGNPLLSTFQFNVIFESSLLLQSNFHNAVPTMISFDLPMIEKLIDGFQQNTAGYCPVIKIRCVTGPRGRGRR